MLWRRNLVARSWGTRSRVCQAVPCQQLDRWRVRFRRYCLSKGIFAFLYGFHVHIPTPNTIVSFISNARWNVSSVGDVIANVKRVRRAKVMIVAFVCVRRGCEGSFRLEWVGRVTVASGTWRCVFQVIFCRLLPLVVHHLPFNLGFVALPSTARPTFSLKLKVSVTLWHNRTFQQQEFKNLNFRDFKGF